MKNYRVSIDGFFTIGELHYMEDVVNEYTDGSVIDGALEGVPENELDHAYWQCIVMEFMRIQSYLIMVIMFFIMIVIIMFK